MPSLSLFTEGKNSLRAAVGITDERDKYVRWKRGGDWMRGEGVETMWHFRFLKCTDHSVSLPIGSFDDIELIVVHTGVIK